MGRGHKHMPFQASWMQACVASLTVRRCGLCFGRRPQAQQLWHQSRAGRGMLCSRAFQIR